MKLENTLRWLTALALAIMLLPTGSSAQDRDRRQDRDGGEDREWRSRSGPTFVMPNMFVQSASRARLGLYLDSGQSRRYDDQGALVTDVMHGSPAEEAGLRDGDIITAFDGQSLTRPLADAELEQELDIDGSLPAQRVLALAREVEPGQTVEIAYLRDGETLSVEITAEEFDFPRVMSFGDEDGGWTVDIGDGRFDFRTDEMAGEIAERVKDLTGRMGNLRGFSGGHALLGGDCPGSMSSFGSDTHDCVAGVELRELNPGLGEYFEAESGVLVIDVDDDSALGLMPGDVIIAVGTREVDDVDRTRRLINSYEEDEPIRLTIIRKGTEQVIEGSLVPY